MFLARFMRAISLRPVRLAAVPDLPKAQRKPQHFKSLTVKLDLDTTEAKAKVQELLDQAREAEAILARVRGS